MTEQDDFESTRKALMRLDEVPDPDPLRRASARHAFLEGASRLRSASAGGRVARRGFRLATALLCAIGLALAGVTGAAYAADAARPGDLLYPLDREMENVQLMLTQGSQQRASLLLAASGERLQEAESLASQGDQRHLDIALENYSQAVSNASQAVDSAKGDEGPALVEQLDQALSAHEQRLESLRQHIPPVDQPGIDRAIAAAHRGHRSHPTAEPTLEATSPNDGSNQDDGQPDSTPAPAEDHRQNPTDDGSTGPGNGSHNGHGGHDHGGHHNDNGHK